jgi:hypothetical protein
MHDHLQDVYTSWRFLITLQKTLIALQMFVTYCQLRPQINYASNVHIEYTENIQQPASFFI